MKAAVIYSPGDVRMIEREIPIPKPDEVLIRIKACGVCGTDHSLFVGGYPANYPVVIGHEFSGDRRGRNRCEPSETGDRVTVDPNRVCRRCDYCRMGKEHLCANVSSMGVHSDGADAEYCVMVESNVYRYRIQSPSNRQPSRNRLPAPSTGWKWAGSSMAIRCWSWAQAGWAT